MQALFENHALPKNWKIERFGQRIKLNYGKSQSAVQTPEGSIPIYGTGGFMGMANQWLSPGDSVLIGRKGTLNNPNYISEPFWAVDTTFYASDFDGSYKWLYYLVKFIDLSRWNEATGVPSLSRAVLYNIDLPFPPVNEQFKIAEILSNIDRAISQTEALIAKHQRIKTGLMQDLLTRGIDEHGQLRDPSTHKFKSTLLGMIPEEWDVKELQKIGEVERGKFTHRPRNDPEYYGGKYSFIQTGDITKSIGRHISEYSQTLSKRGVQVSKEFPKGTIAVTIAANIADTAILAMPMFFPDSIVGVVVNKENSIRFVEMCIRQQKYRLENLAPQSAQKNINLETLRPLLIPAPRKEEQELISQIYDRALSIIENHERKLQNLQRVKTGLMQDLLSGEVSVTPLMENK